MTYYAPIHAVQGYFCPPEDFNESGGYHPLTGTAWPNRCPEWVYVQYNGYRRRGVNLQHDFQRSYRTV